MQAEIEKGRQKGRELFSSGDFSSALALYKELIEKIQGARKELPKSQQEFEKIPKESLEVFYVNCGLCLMKLSKSLEASKYFDLALEANPGNEKALFNKTNIKIEEKDYNEAAILLSRLKHVNPSNKKYDEMLRELVLRYRKEDTVDLRVVSMKTHLENLQISEFLQAYSRLAEDKESAEIMKRILAKGVLEDAKKIALKPGRQYDTQRLESFLFEVGEKTSKYTDQSIESSVLWTLTRYIIEGGVTESRIMKFGHLLSLSPCRFEKINQMLTLIAAVPKENVNLLFKALTVLNSHLANESKPIDGPWDLELIYTFSRLVQKTSPLSLCILCSETIANYFKVQGKFPKESLIDQLTPDFFNLHKSSFSIEQVVRVTGLLESDPDYFTPILSQNKSFVRSLLRFFESFYMIQQQAESQSTFSNHQTYCIMDLLGLLSSNKKFIASAMEEILDIPSMIGKLFPVLSNTPFLLLKLFGIYAKFLLVFNDRELVDHVKLVLPFDSIEKLLQQKEEDLQPFILSDAVDLLSHLTCIDQFKLEFLGVDDSLLKILGLKISKQEVLYRHNIMIYGLVSLLSNMLHDRYDEIRKEARLRYGSNDKDVENLENIIRHGQGTDQLPKSLYTNQQIKVGKVLERYGNREMGLVGALCQIMKNSKGGGLSEKTKGIAVKALAKLSECKDNVGNLSEGVLIDFCLDFYEEIKGRKEDFVKAEMSPKHFVYQFIGKVVSIANPNCFSTHRVFALTDLLCTSLIESSKELVIFESILGLVQLVSLPNIGKRVIDNKVWNRIVMSCADSNEFIIYSAIELVNNLVSSESSAQIIKKTPEMSKDITMLSGYLLSDLKEIKEQGLIGKDSGFTYRPRRVDLILGIMLMNSEANEIKVKSYSC